MSSSDHPNAKAELVRNQLSKILSSQEFTNSHVVSRFLEFVVEEALAGRANEIKEYTIGVKALGKSADFNPQFEAVVRIHAGRLRRMLREYYNGNGSSDLLLIDIPKGSYVPAFKSLNNVDGEHDGVKSANGVGTRQDNGLYRKATVAVFPFHNLSADDSKNYFAEGIGEQLCVELARFRHLSVISYYATCKLSAERDGREMHNLFDIDYAISGSTRFFDGLVQINVQLTAVETYTVLWSQSFVRQFNADHILRLQQDVLRHVLYKIADQDGIISQDMANTPSKKKNTFGVYDAVYLYFSLRGRYDAESFDMAKTAVEKAAALDPGNALVWALLARLFVNRYIFKPEPDTEDLQKGRAYAEKALWLDHDCQYAYKALAWSHLLGGETNECKEAIDRCLHLNENAHSILGSLAFLNVCIGRYAEGFSLLTKVSDLNQILPWYCNIGFALYYYYVGRYQEAYDWAQKAGPGSMPLISLVRFAAAHKLHGATGDKNVEPHSLSPDLAARAPSLASVFIHDLDLRDRLLKEIISPRIVRVRN